jgi:hypothetical protein
MNSREDTIRTTSRVDQGLGFEAAEKLADAVLHEGRLLYPYRPSSTKNRKRWSFGTLYPQSSEAVLCGLEQCRQRTQCLLMADGSSQLQVRMRFLQLISRIVDRAIDSSARCLSSDQMASEPVESLLVDGLLYESWEESLERTVETVLLLEEAIAAPKNLPFVYASSTNEEMLYSGGACVGRIRRVQQHIGGSLSISVQPLESHLFKLTLETINASPLIQESEPNLHLKAFLSAHSIMRLERGEFVSVLDPPEHLCEHVSACNNVGTFPVLVGDSTKHQLLLSSPIILYDFAEVAPESQGDFCDATEIDELLTLRIRTLTDDEKKQMRHTDAQAQELLARSEATTQDQLMSLHGTFRAVRPTQSGREGETAPRTANAGHVEKVVILGVEVKPGSRVRLRPSIRADAFDMFLQDRIAIVESIECDYEDNLHIAVVLEDDPGCELGLMRQPGHRFFFSPREIEPLAAIFGEFHGS